jgi:hypothetical protein
MVWRNPFRNRVVRRSNGNAANEPDVPWALLVAVVVLCFVLVIALPVMGVMYMDMNNALYRAEQETRKMKELRIKVLREMRGEE